MAGTAELGPGSDSWLTEHMAAIRQEIVDRAAQLAKRSNSPLGSIEPRFVAEAAREFAPGTVVPHQTRWRRLTAGITGITVIWALLALVFGALALLKVDSSNTSGFLDIAKLLAGAVVGSTGASVVAQT